MSFLTAIFLVYGTLLYFSEHIDAIPLAMLIVFVALLACGALLRSCSHDLLEP